MPISSISLYSWPFLRPVYCPINARKFYNISEILSKEYKTIQGKKHVVWYHNDITHVHVLSFLIQQK